jgi:hypothetical protein
MSQLQALLSDLSASIGLGAYDLSSIPSNADLVELFKGKIEPPTRIHEFIGATWTKK